MLPNPAMRRLEHYGYGTPAEILNRIAARLVALPGVANDPVTKSSIDIILRMELNPNADPLDSPESVEEIRRDSGKDKRRTTDVIPTL